jgi:hypothetical protein
MSEEFFSNYPKIQYDLYRNGSSVELTDICRAAIINSELVSDNATNYTYYDIFDGDRPDTVSYKIYGTVDHYWTFFLINDHLRSGLNAQWPLSYSDFTKYINKKYAQYSCISFIPQENIDDKGILDFSIVPLDDKYLPYLRLTSSANGGSRIASIDRYDSARQQLIVYDIHGVRNSNRYEIIRDSFIKNSGNFVNPNYRLLWQHPHIDPSDYAIISIIRGYENFIKLFNIEKIQPTTTDIAQFGREQAEKDAALKRSEDRKKIFDNDIKITEEDLTIVMKTIYDKNEAMTEKFKTYAEDYTISSYLKEEWVNKLYEYLKQPKIDYVGWKNHIEYGQTKEQYIFSKYFVAAADIFRWTSYAEAAHSYYSADQESIISAYDIIKTENVVYPNYVSFNDYETSLNDKKTSIKIIRPEHINEFITAYFETLTT